jgi:hypothetical protein
MRRPCRAGVSTLGGLASVAALFTTKKKTPMPGNVPVSPKVVKSLGTTRRVRTGEF